MKIWKFLIYKPSVSSLEQVVGIPEGAKFLCVEEQGGWMVLWAMVDPKKPEVKRHFQIVLTGGDVPKASTYWGTVQFFNGDFVVHLYEVSDAN